MHSNGNGTSGLRISVAMCTFNGGRYLEQQLESIAEQTQQPCELVVCDDGSTDDTIAILKRFKANAPFPVTVVENAVRMGSTSNFDQAIGMARGEFIALCDQDDRWLPHKLERLSDCLVENPFPGWGVLRCRADRWRRSQSGQDFVWAAQIHAGETAELCKLSDRDASETRCGDWGDSDVPVEHPARIARRSRRPGFTMDGWRGCLRCTRVWP